MAQGAGSPIRKPFLFVVLGRGQRCSRPWATLPVGVCNVVRGRGQRSTPFLAMRRWRNVERMSHVEQAKFIFKNWGRAWKFFFVPWKNFFKRWKKFFKPWKIFFHACTIFLKILRSIRVLRCLIVWGWQLADSKGEALKKKRYARAWLHIKTSTPLYKYKRLRRCLNACVKIQTAAEQ